jgi:hypothetical protein
MKWTIVAILTSAVLLSACPGNDSASEANKAGLLACTSFGGAGAVWNSTSGPTCLDCSFADLPMAVDGDYSTSAVMRSSIGVHSSIAIMGRPPQHEILAAGTTAGVLTDITYGNSVEILPNTFLRTYLAGQQQEEVEVDGNGSNVVTGNVIGGTGLIVYSYKTQMPYDTVELAVVGELQNGFTAEVFEFCSDP